MTSTTTPSKIKKHFEASLKTKKVAIDSITPSVENDSVYGAIDPADIDLVNLANDIAQNGLREPIQVSLDGYVISGHRRLAACKLVQLSHVLVTTIAISRDDYTSDEWKKKLVAYNLQRVKSNAVRMKETLVNIDPDLAHQQLIEQREERDRDAPPQLAIQGTKTRSTISDRKQEFLTAAVAVIEGLKDYWPVTVRQVHYGLLNDPPLRNSSSGPQRSKYENNVKSYNDLCNLLTRARLKGVVDWKAICDETRPTSGLRFQKDAASFVDLEMHNFLRGYHRDLLQSQPDHVELIVEKLTVQGIIEPIAKKYCMPMTVGRGYCSIDPRHEIVLRYKRSGKDRLKLLIAADFDPDGEEIAESFVRSIRDDFGIDDVTASKILLRQDQVKQWDLPYNGMEAKEDSTKFNKFMKRYGENCVFELEAVSPPLMQKTIQEGIEATIDMVAFNAEIRQEKKDAARLQSMKSNIQDSFLGMLENGGAE